MIHSTNLINGSLLPMAGVITASDPKHSIEPSEKDLITEKAQVVFGRLVENINLLKSLNKEKILEICPSIRADINFLICNTNIYIKKTYDDLMITAKEAVEIQKSLLESNKIIEETKRELAKLISREESLNPKNQINFLIEEIKIDTELMNKNKKRLINLETEKKEVSLSIEMYKKTLLVLENEKSQLNHWSDDNALRTKKGGIKLSSLETINMELKKLMSERKFLIFDLNIFHELNFELINEMIDDFLKIINEKKTLDVNIFISM